MSLPAIQEPELIDDFFPQYSPQLAKLTALQKQILYELVINIASEDKQTDTDIAENLGIDRKTIYNARRDPNFAGCLAGMVRDITKGLVDKAIGNLVTLKDNVKAQEILLRIAEVYNPTQRLLTLSGKLPTDGYENIVSPQQLTERIVSQFAQLGYDKQRLLDEIGQKWEELKANGSI